MNAWIIGEMDLVKNCINATLAGITPESQLGDELRLLTATTGPMTSVEAWEWNRTTKGSTGIRLLLRQGGGEDLGSKKCRVSAAITDPDELPLLKVLGLFQIAAQVTATNDKWIDVLNYRCFVKLPIADLTNTVPAYLPSRTYVDEAAVEQTHTWQSWAEQRSGQVIQQDDTHAYISTSGGTGYPLCGSLLYSLAGSGHELVEATPVVESV